MDDQHWDNDIKLLYFKDKRKILELQGHTHTHTHTHTQTSHTDNTHIHPTLITENIPSSKLLVSHHKIDPILSYKETSNKFHKIGI